MGGCVGVLVVYIHSPVACTFCLHIGRARSHFAHFHACAHTRMAQAQVVSKRCLLHMYLTSPSRLLYLMFHPSLLFLCIHFDISFLSTILPYFPVQKSGGHAPLRTCIEEFGYLAKSDANTGGGGVEGGRREGVGCGGGGGGVCVCLFVWEGRERRGSGGGGADGVLMRDLCR